MDFQIKDGNGLTINAKSATIKLEKMDNKTRDGVIDYINKMISKIEEDMGKFHWLCNGLANSLDRSHSNSVYYPHYVTYLEENKPSPKQHPLIYSHISFVKSHNANAWWRYWSENLTIKDVNEQKILFLKILLKNI